MTRRTFLTTVLGAAFAAKNCTLEPVPAAVPVIYGKPHLQGAMKWLDDYDEFLRAGGRPIPLRPVSPDLIRRSSITLKELVERAGWGDE